MEIRYTLDGSEPDSLKSQRYTNGVEISNSSVLKAKAFMQGWVSSEVAERSYFKAGLTPDSIRLDSPPAEKYTGIGAKTLINLEKGETNFRTPKWLGYKEDPLITYMYFNNATSISGISFSCLIDIGSYIMPPSELEVWGGESDDKLSLLGKLKPVQPDKSVTPYLSGFDVQWASTNVKVLKLIGRPVSRLPAWHPGKGQKAWIFVDEIFINP